MLNRFSVSTIWMLAAVNGALAQATPPAGSGTPAAPSTDGGGMSWLWIIIALVIIAGIVWYFTRGRSRTTAASTTTAAGTTGTSTTSSRLPGEGPQVYDNKTRK